MVALFLPGVVLILGSGFVFGFWRGLLAVWAGGAVGQALAFLLARYLFHGWVETTLKQRWKKWAIIDKAIEHDGWKLVLIMRFSPIIPYNLVCACWGVSGGALIWLGAQRLLCLWLQCQSSAGCVFVRHGGGTSPARQMSRHPFAHPPACLLQLNIAMATTNIPFWQFTIVSAVGIIYECAVFAYFGRCAAEGRSCTLGAGTAAGGAWARVASGSAVHRKLRRHRGCG